MGSSRKSSLRLHRETLRNLAPGELERVAGGDRIYRHVAPKSNVWTGDGGYEPAAYCNYG